MAQLPFASASEKLVKPVPNSWVTQRSVISQVQVHVGFGVAPDFRDQGPGIRILGQLLGRPHAVIDLLVEGQPGCDAPGSIGQSGMMVLYLALKLLSTVWSQDRRPYTAVSRSRESERLLVLVSVSWREGPCRV